MALSLELFVNLLATKYLKSISIYFGDAILMKQTKWYESRSALNYIMCSFLLYIASIRQTGSSQFAHTFF